MFVRATGGEFAPLGIGKQIDRQGSVCSVAYFDAPTADMIVQEIDVGLLQSVILPEQTRVYHFNLSIGAWEIGRLLDDHGDTQFVQFPNKSTRHLNVVNIFVRWAKPIVDPTPFLANHINESPRFSDGRSAFTRSQMSQRAAALGMSALLSSAVELESHQIEVVRRILQDPVQRYLLADEVGLGKTIEAGILIRQCVLDCGDGVTIVVIVPEALVLQWREELTEKFFLERQLDRSVHVVGAGNVAAAMPLLARADMLVIDEAHHLIEHDKIGETYTAIAGAALSIERILLLSATPVLHNERGFLAMLHLLDPINYPIDGIEAFRTKIGSRQALAEIVAGLVPENALYLDYTLDALTERFPDDALLQDHVAKLRVVVEQMPSEDDPDLVEAIGRARAHLSEVYRLHRRILRHRRRKVMGLTPDRAGARICRYASADRQALTSAIEAWIFSEGVALSDGDAATAKHRHSALWQALERASLYPVSGAGMVGFLAQRAELVGDRAAFSAIAKLLGRTGLFEDRAAVLVEVLQEALDDGNKCVIFCTDGKTADALVSYIQIAITRPVDRHDPLDGAWRRFNDDPKHGILVCDRRAEEGLNLQGGRKVVVHYDMPLNPNRIEQRMGRVDRYGSGDPVRSILLVCEEDPLEIAWTRYIDTALKLFDRSVASLQYLTDATVRSLPALLFEEGTEALDRLTDAHAGDGGRIETELRSIDQQDALDALGTPPTDLTDQLCEVDDAWREIAENTTLWLEQTLAFGRLPLDGAEGGDDRASPFRYRYTTDRGHTLLPLPTFMSACGESLDFTPDQRLGRAIKTVPFCFQRRAVLSRRGREAGMRLLRYGDPFLTGVGEITDADDRGRSFALWREDPHYSADQAADAYLRFDFLVEVDLLDAFTALEALGEDGFAARAALRRRGDLMLAPSFSTIWIDAALNIVPQGGLRALLDRPYRPVARGQGPYHDINVNARRWQRVKAIGIDVVAHWAELCTKGRQTAEALLRADPDFIAKLRAAETDAAEADYARITQLEVRLRQDPDGLSGQLDLERAIATATRQGIIQPRVRLETIGAVFLTGSAAVTERMMGGE